MNSFGITYPHGASPQQKAGIASGHKRREEAARRRKLEAIRAKYPNEHKRGEHDASPLIGCPLCKARINAWIDAHVDTKEPA